MRPIDADALKENAVDTDYMPTDKWISVSDLENAPTIEPATAEWISGDCETYDKVICSNCASEPIISFDEENNAVYWLTPYCPFCGRKNKINLKEE